jgi:SAM-dependent methyltransferase
MAESFDGDWLELREPFDSAARDPGLAAILGAALPARPRILDLGAGTGSLLRWMGHFVGRAQAWTLVDADAALIERAFETIAERAAGAGWGVTWPGRKTLLVHSPRGAWRVEGLVADLREAPDNLPLHQVDAVVNTALCDLVSEAWVATIAAACAARALPFYAALNVTGRERFAPPHRADALVARGFARDQARDKGFGGIALGAKAPDAIAAAFRAHGYTVLRAPSDWVVRTRPLNEATSAFAAELLGGMAGAAGRWERRHRLALRDWARERMDQAMEGRLSFRIGHADVLCLPPGKGTD